MPFPIGGFLQKMMSLKFVTHINYKTPHFGLAWSASTFSMVRMGQKRWRHRVFAFSRPKLFIVTLCVLGVAYMESVFMKIENEITPLQWKVNHRGNFRPCELNARSWKTKCWKENFPPEYKYTRLWFSSRQRLKVDFCFCPDFLDCNAPDFWLVEPWLHMEEKISSLVYQYFALLSITTKVL